MPCFSARRILTIAALFVATAALHAQSANAQSVSSSPRALTHDDYDQWKSLRGTTYSLDGNWVAYQVEPQFGDGVLEIRQVSGDAKYSEPLASGARFSTDGRFVVFTIGKSKVAERDKKIADLRKKAKEAKEGKKPGAEKEGEKAEGEAGAAETPRRGPGGAAGAFAGRGGAGGRRGPGGAGAPAAGGPGGADRGEFAVLDLQTGKVEKIGKVKGFTLSDDVAMLLYQPEKPEPKTEDKKDEGKAETPKEGEKAGEAGAEVVVETPKTEEPKTEEPKAGEPKAEEPKTETPPAEGERPAGRRGGRRGGGFAGGPGTGPRPAATETTPTDPLEKKRAEGSELVIRDLTTGVERKLADVVSYGLSRQSKWLWYHTSAKKPAKDTQYGLFVVPLAGGEPMLVHEGTVHVSNVTWDRDEKVLAFTSDKEDFAADKPRSDVYLWEGQHEPARCIVHAGTPGLPDDMRLSGGVSFSRDGSVLQLSVSPKPAEDPLPILPEDKVTLDLWNWQDGQLQTQQQKGGGFGRRESRTAVFHRDQNRFLVLGDDQMGSMRFVGPDGARMLGSEGKAYDKETSWDGRYQDIYLVNSLDGTRAKILEKLRGNVTNSPGGRFLIWFGADYHWWCYDVATGARRDLTGNLPVAFHKEDDDHPEPDGAHGIAGWTEGDAAVLLYDEFDLWKVSVTTGEAVCVTDGYGRANHVRLRIQSLPRKDDSDYLSGELMLAATQTDSMAEGIFVDSLDKATKPVRLFMTDKNLADVTRPKESSRFFFTQSTFAEFPDLWTANSDFSGLKKLSDANPQQKDYRWGKEELVSWIDGDGNKNNGVLIKPDGFDPNKKYPMMVYFYEQMTQGLHNYVAPAPGTSPNASYYVSNGYLWFMPDVRYEIGYPGASCVKSVVSGVQSLIAKGFVDEKGIGAAGHSWGGYQTAFLVTRTNIFAAVESGAPVSNMISAYGGIRYSSGMSRQFQYEQTQSRIGGTPWEYPMRYWENSPIFFADKVRTPVLIMANDQDGAVPWTQGIEYFTALRRLGRECYLFNYNGEDHGLRQRQNMKDWTRRMSEYFAHHLKKEPAPKWMQEGVPYQERDAEKLPFAQSYIDAYVKPAPEEKAPAAAEATAKPEAATPVEAKAAPSGDSKPAESSAPAARVDGPRGRRGGGEAASVPAKLAKGAVAPDFAVADERGAVQKLADYRGRMVLVWFYPKADTPGCTAEGCGLRDQMEEFRRRDVAVLGVSFDAPEDNAAFRRKHDLPFPLLSDADRTMAIAYGAAENAEAKVARRIAVLIDGEGKVVQYWGRVDPRTFAATAVAALPL
jgi:peroxiredoxin/dienelactone hydrolase